MTDEQVEKSEGGDTIESRSVSTYKVPPTLAPKLEDRIIAFNLDLSEILEKHQFGLGAEAYIFDGKVHAKPVVVDALTKVDTDN